jgi:hypothetical protein
MGTAAGRKGASPVNRTGAGVAWLAMEGLD